MLGQPTDTTTFHCSLLLGTISQKFHSGGKKAELGDISLKTLSKTQNSPDYNLVMPTLPLLAGDLRFFASSPALPLWYISLPLFTSTINIEYLVKNKTDLV